MDFMQKVEGQTITLIDFYLEGTGIFFSTNSKYYFAESIRKEFWILIVAKPFFANFAGRETQRVYYTRYPNIRNGPYELRMLDIKSKQDTGFPIDSYLNKPITWFTNLQDRVFLIQTKDVDQTRDWYVYKDDLFHWLDYDGGFGGHFFHVEVWFYALNEGRCELIGYDLNKFSLQWKISLEPFSRYKENLNNDVYNPGRMDAFLGLFGNELVLLVSNQLLLSVYITTGEVSWASEPLLNYIPTYCCKFNYKTQQYTWLEGAEKRYILKNVEATGEPAHSPILPASHVAADNDRGYVYMISSHYLLELHVPTKEISITHIAALLPYPNIHEFSKIYCSRGLLYIPLAIDSAMPSVLTVYNPVTKQFELIHEMTDTVTEVLFFDDNFYVVGWEGDLYEFKR